MPRANSPFTPFSIINKILRSFSWSIIMNEFMSAADSAHMNFDQRLIFALIFLNSCFAASIASGAARPEMRQDVSCRT